MFKTKQANKQKTIAYNQPMKLFPLPLLFLADSVFGILS